MLIQPNIVTKGGDSLSTSVTGSAVGAFLSTHQPNLAKAERAITSSSYDAAVPTTTEPTTTAQTSLLFGINQEGINLLKVVPYASINNAGAPMMRVIGWNSYPQGASTLYVPTLLAELTMAYNATGGSIPSASVDGSTRHFFHNITVGSGVPTVNVYAPGTAAGAGTPPAHALIDTVGSQYVTIQFKSTTTSSNTLGAMWYAI